MSEQMKRIGDPVEVTEAELREKLAASGTNEAAVEAVVRIANSGAEITIGDTLYRVKR